MSQSFAIDFGTCNTILARWDPVLEKGLSCPLSDYSRSFAQGKDEVFLIPSIIHFDQDGARYIGNQVIDKELYASNHTFRWMKRYIGNRSPIQMRFKNFDVTPAIAGKAFLSALVQNAAAEWNLEPDTEWVFTVPVDSFEHYENWLSGITSDLGFARFRLIDEPSAAALGYGITIQPGRVFLLFDFGGGTMHAAVVLIEREENLASGRRCRILGKAARPIGGATIDQWLYEFYTSTCSIDRSGSAFFGVSNSVLASCEVVKEQLSHVDKVCLPIQTGKDSAMPPIEVTKDQFEEILDEHDLFSSIQQCTRAAIALSRDHGYDEEMIDSVILVGGSCQIPAVQKFFKQTFGRDRVFCDRPMDAVAGGAASFAAGIDFYDHIQHDYAIRYLNREKGGYDYQPIVRRGAHYPTAGPVASLVVKASYSGQTRLGIAVIEMGKPAKGPAPVEIVFDPSGAACLAAPTPYEIEQRSFFWMNENNPTFLIADPPAQEGEPRFDVTFAIDSNKRLTIHARDLHTGRLVLADYPVVKLS